MDHSLFLIAAMGIRGFSSFIRKEFRHWKSINYRGKVIIDGTNICYSISKTIPWGLCGEYDKFASKVKEFFENYPFRDPIVVFDGAMCDNSKNGTACVKRKSSMINMSEVQKSDCIDTSSAGPSNVLPTLTLITFIATLGRLGIEYCIADGESDRDVAALAYAHECPVLSSDSDFYIFNLEHGFIHFDRLLDTARPLYYISDFLRQFRLEDYELCVMIPAFFGNGSIEPKVDGRRKTYRLFLENLSKYRTCTHFKRSAEGRKIESADFQHALKFYSYFGINISYSGFLPEWVYQKYKEGKFSIILCEVWLKKNCLQPRILETIEYEAAWKISQSIRQQAYHGMIGPCEVTEIIRENCKVGFNKELVPSIAPKVVCEDDPLKFVLCILLQTEAVPLEFLQLDDKWKLPIAATYFWYKKISSSPFGERFVVALLLGFLTCSDLLPRKAFGYPVMEADKRDVYLKAFHAYAQWQCVYSDAIGLNYLAREPFPTIDPARLYSGEITMGYALGNEPVGSVQIKLFDDFLSLVTKGTLALS